MREERITTDRLAAFSDAVFAVIVTIMVLELKAPEQPEFSARLTSAIKLKPLRPFVSRLSLATCQRHPQFFSLRFQS